MDKSIIAAGRRLGGHQYVPLVHHWLRDGYAPLILSLMRLHVAEVIYKGSYRLPDDACPTFAALYETLQALEADLHEHIHLENNILFPASVSQEARMNADPA